ncbi:hypothetical protein MNEG_1961 [Monoraphidium neglectum]|uniref:Hexosyltransferase n=1 Tax=Monoraphidium neglectum TaxID=145388 RepID=A0A0D2K6N5_9CHLO|nr:hypothetical protein MNEG_1961 [Monoraphidium neglectum]KIZ05988.1 hypothetical protein MNEG_1961 [Monoraphidium neglectum]|eukprot:XP_013905007.1 hypothetical protein MNEG_1961 [Monoraphidium neglectum]
MAAEKYDADWVVKVDDDVYLSVERLLLAMKQWDRMEAGYVGCLKNGAVWTEPGTRWYEPQHLLLGSNYYLHSYGSIYALRGRAVEDVIVRNLDNLRLLANEDTMVGLWMLAHGVKLFEDMRLCSPTCT